MKITFCGAARIVTGSCYLLESGKDKVLVDCGMFQGVKETTRLNYEPFRFDPEKISHVLLTHAHIDHSGLLPKLVAEGFGGKVLATSGTIDLCRIMLEDSAEVQKTETENENKRRQSEGLPPRLPLYTMDDVQACLPLFEEVEYERTYPVNRNLQVRYLDAGHIIGSSIIELYATDNRTEKKIVFSGDLGQWGAPIVSDPEKIEETDYLVVESTYGGRKHKEISTRDEQLLEHILEAHSKGGKLLIPSFAVERTQELLFSLKKLHLAKKLPAEKVFLDSPLAIKATEVFEGHREYLDKEASKYPDPFTFKNLVYSNTVEESKEINELRQPCIVIAGNGMATGGRIRHHIRHGIEDPRNTLLFVGYQAEGTTGRKILDGAKKIRMMGHELKVRADIRSIDSFSAHADHDGLLRWLDGFKARPKKTFIVHGEPESMAAFAEALKTRNYNYYIPQIGETVEI